MAQVEIMPGASMGACASFLLHASNGYGNLLGAAITDDSVLHRRYIDYVVDEGVAATFLLSAATIDRLFTTLGFNRIAQLPPYLPQVGKLVRAEIERCQRECEQAVDEVNALRRMWVGAKQIIVPDTNVFVHHPRPFGEIDWFVHAEEPSDRIDVVIPLIIIEELDRIKDGPRGKRATKADSDDTRTRAAKALAQLAHIFDNPKRLREIVGAVWPEHGAVYLRVHVDDGQVVRRPRVDAEIVATAVRLQDVSGAPASVVSYDTSMRLRAKAAGLRAVEPRS